jgi:oxepin-CoA hydrolase/3-oxo-5,6-dehydrosuberyl-CoA semialdehyde dehydrogenase
MIEVKSYLMGAWVAGERKSELVDPSTEEVIGSISAERPNLAPVLEHARKVGGPALRALSFAERGAILKSLSKAIHTRREALIEVSITSGGTTRSDAKFDIDGASGTLAYYAALGAKLGDTRLLAEPSEQLGQDSRFFGQHVWLSREGAAVHVNAFNFPAWGLAEKLAVAILAGVPVITKPATSTCILAFRVAEAIVEASVLPPGTFHFVAGSLGDLVEQLGPQDVLAFTGSADTGAKLRGARSVVHRSTRVNVEADSLNSAVLALGIEPGDDVYRIFLRDVAKEMTQKTGQKCTATRRVFVPRALADRVQEDLSEELSRVKIGHPGNDEVRMGPLATKQQLEDFRAGVAKLVASGARLVHGDPNEAAPIGVPAGKGFFAAPVLLRADAPAAAEAVHAHEVFGPCATICPYDSSEEAVALVARGEGGLVTTIYGDDRETLRALVLGISPHHGRVLVVSAKVADKTISPGLVLPSCVHGGPGRAGGGEELGGERGLRFYMQRTAVQGDRALLDKLFEAPKPA